MVGVRRIDCVASATLNSILGLVGLSKTPNPYISWSRFERKRTISHAAILYA